MRRPTASPALSAPRALTLALALAGALTLAACTPPEGSAADQGSPSPDPSASEEATTDPGDDATTPEDSASPGSGGSEGSDAVDDVEHVLGLPTGVEEPGEDTTGGVGWAESGDSLYVVTYGSSSCPLVPTSVEAEDTTIEIALVQAGGAVCTADYVPTTSTVQAPPALDPATPVTAVLGELGQVTVPAAATPPAFGWTTAEG